MSMFSQSLGREQHDLDAFDQADGGTGPPTHAFQLLSHRLV